MTEYRLAIDGDPHEKRCWHLFVQSDFPSYETFWLRHVVPLTNRPDNIYLKTDAELKAIGKTDNDVCISQLHYSILIQLERVYELRTIPLADFTGDDLAWGFTSLVGAQDLAFELLQRRKKAHGYNAWSSMEGRNAKQDWQTANNHPLDDLRKYRNNLVHGRMVPNMITGFVSLPKIGKQEEYFDWRRITDPLNKQGYNRDDFVSAREILEDAWRQTIDYLETEWCKLLGMTTTKTSRAVISIRTVRPEQKPVIPYSPLVYPFGSASFEGH